jgi:hypothetical protein
MPHWVTFDHSTSAALSSRLPEAAVVNLPSHEPLEHALASKEAVVAVLPGGQDQTAVAVFRWKRVHVRAEDPNRHSGTRASGMLGLSDESFVEEEDASRTKKSWWAKFWDL